MKDAMVKAEEQSEYDLNARMFVDIKSRSKGFYGLLLSKINKKQTATTSGVRDGFELFRRISRDEDPITDTTAYTLRLAFQNMAYNKCKNLEETWKYMSEIEQKLTEYREKTGTEMHEEIKSTVLHGAMDAETF